LSLDQSKQLDSPNGKITPAVLLPLMANRQFLVKFWKCQKAVSILPHEAKALLEVFFLQPIVIGERQNRSSSSFASWGKIKIHDFALTDQDWIDWWFSKILWIRTGLYSILSGLDSDWKISQIAHLC